MNKKIILLLVLVLVFSGCVNMFEPPRVPFCKDINEVGIDCYRLYQIGRETYGAVVCKEVKFYGSNAVTEYCYNTLNEGVNQLKEDIKEACCEVCESRPQDLNK